MLSWRILSLSRHFRPFMLLHRRSLVNRFLNPFMGGFGLTGFIMLETLVVFAAQSVFALLPSFIMNAGPVITTVVTASAPVIRELGQYLMTTTPLPWNDYLVGLSLYYGSVFLQGLGVYLINQLGQNYLVLAGAWREIISNVDLTFLQRVSNVLLFIPMSLYYFGAIPLWECFKAIIALDWTGVADSEAIRNFAWLWGLFPILWSKLGFVFSYLSPPVCAGATLLGGVLKYTLIGFTVFCSTSVSFLAGVVRAPYIGLNWLLLWLLHLIGF